MPAHRKAKSNKVSDLVHVRLKPSDRIMLRRVRRMHAEALGAELPESTFLRLVVLLGLPAMVAEIKAKSIKSEG